MPDARPRAASAVARTGRDGLSAIPSREAAMPPPHTSSRVLEARRSARNPNGTLPRPKHAYATAASRPRVTSSAAYSDFQTTRNTGIARRFAWTTPWRNPRGATMARSSGRISAAIPARAIRLRRGACPMLGGLVQTPFARSALSAQECKGKGWGKAGSKLVFRLAAARVGLAFALLALAPRLLDDLLLDDRLRGGGLADHPARDRLRPRGSRRRSRRTERRSGRPGGRLRGRAAGLACLDHGRGASSAAARRPRGLPHERAALVAHGGRHRVEGPAGRARLGAHLAHLLFLAEPVLEGHEGRLLAPPLLEFAVRQGAAELPRRFLLELRDDLVVLEAHLLLVVGHLDLAGRELDAALGALLHVDRDPGLAVRALRHVLLELHAALGTGGRILGDEGSALAALDHLAEAEDLDVQGHADPDGRGGRQDHEEQPERDAEERQRSV